MGKKMVLLERFSFCRRLSAVVKNCFGIGSYYVEWEKTGDNASATFSLPNITVSLRNETAIPAYLTSISVKYSTKLGDSISQLPQYSRKYEITLAANSTTDFEVALYYPDILNFVEFTTSDIFPINATIFVEITDVNNNKIYSEANCIVYKPDDRVAYTAPVTTTNPPPPHHNRSRSPGRSCYPCKTKY
jgi:hypothetical protein